jgi:hypothetical protein
MDVHIQRLSMDSLKSIEYPRIFIESMDISYDFVKGFIGNIQEFFLTSLDSNTF